MEIASKWAVSQEHAVDGAVTDAMVADWIDGACRAYLAECGRLSALAREAGAELRYGPHDVPAASELGRPASVLASATAPEVRPSSFTIAVRLRPIGGDVDRPLNLRCTVRVEDLRGEALPLGKEIRDELIAIEQAARYMN